MPFTDIAFRERLEEAMQVAQSRLKSALIKELNQDGANDIEVMFKTKVFSSSEDGVWSQGDIDHIEIIARAVGNPSGL